MADSLTAPGTVNTLPSSAGSKNNPPLIDQLQDAHIIEGPAPSGAKKAEGV